MHSSPSSLVFFISPANSLVLFTWWMVFPTRGLRILASSFITPYVTEPLLDAKDLRGMSFLWIFDSP